MYIMGGIYAIRSHVKSVSQIVNSFNQNINKINNFYSPTPHAIQTLEAVLKKTVFKKNQSLYDIYSLLFI